MPNWCSNTIYTTNPDVVEVFKKLEKRQEESGHGETLDWFNDDRYLFDINIYGDFIHFETKWGPALKTAQAIAKVLNTTIELSYDEPGMCIYGKAIFNPKGEVTDYYLTDSDFDKYKYDEEEDCYIYNDECYESDSEIKEELLELRIAAQIAAQTAANINEN